MSASSLAATGPEPGPPAPGEVDRNDEAVFGPGGDPHEGGIWAREGRDSSSPRPAGHFFSAAVQRTTSSALRVPYGRIRASRKDPAEHVAEILGPRQQRPIAYRLFGVRARRPRPGAARCSSSISHTGTLRACGREDEAVERSGGRAGRASRDRSVEDPLPVELVAVHEDDVRDVGAVEALALHHERLGPERSPPPARFALPSRALRAPGNARTTRRRPGPCRFRS